jgi:hypothetical protein
LERERIAFFLRWIGEDCHGNVAGTIEVDERKVMHFYQNHNVGTVIIDCRFVAATVAAFSPSAAMCGAQGVRSRDSSSLFFLSVTSPLPSARLTFPIPNNQADALIHLSNSSITNPAFAAIPFVQHDGTTSLHGWGVTCVTARFVRPRPQSDEPYLAYLLTLAGITRTRLTNTSTVTSPSTNNTAIGTGTSDDSHPLPRVTVIHSPPDAQSPPAPDIVQDLKAAAIRLLERSAQDTSQSTRKRESWARIAHVVGETEPDKAAALADAIVSAVGADHADKVGECQ